MTLTNLNHSASFIEAFGKDEFKPFAYYDKHLDCIRVYIRDCSVVEERLSRIFTIHKAVIQIMIFIQVLILKVLGIFLKK